MPRKFDSDATPGDKLLRLFRRLMLDGQRHFLSDLAEEMRCSPQTVGRLIRAIGNLLGDSLEEGFEQRRRWYRLRSASISARPAFPDLECAELRWISVCRDLLAPLLPEAVRQRLDANFINLALLLAENGSENDPPDAGRFAFFSKGRIDYAPHLGTMETLLRAAEEGRVCFVRYRASGEKEEKERRLAIRQLAAMNGALPGCRDGTYCRAKRRSRVQL